MDRNGTRTTGAGATSSASPARCVLLASGHVLEVGEVAVEGAEVGVPPRVAARAAVGLGQPVAERGCMRLTTSARTEMSASPSFAAK